MGHGKPHYQYRLGDVRMEHSPVKKDLGVLVDGKLKMSQYCVLTSQKADCILGCIKRRVVNREKKLILPPCSALVRSHLSTMSRCGVFSRGETRTSWNVSRREPQK